MSDDPKSKQKNDDFFTPPQQNDRPGAFTNAFGIGEPAPPPSNSPEQSKKPAESSPFTAQFGNANPFAPIPEDAVPKSVGPSNISGAFTRMFGADSVSAPPDSSHGEMTRVFEAPSTPPAPSGRIEPRAPGGFTDAFGSASAMPTYAESDPDRTPSREFFKMDPPPDPRTASRDISLASPAAKAPGFTELFSGQQPLPSAPPTAAPSNQPGEFTRMMSGAPSASKPPDPNRASSTDIFNLGPTSSEQPVRASANPGGFTDVFSGQPAAPTPAPAAARPQGEFTRMMSGADLASRQPAPRDSSIPTGNTNPVGHSAATRLFTPSDAVSAPLPTGPSEYTRVVSASQMRDLQAAGMNGGPNLSGGATPPTAPAGSPMPPSAAWPNMGMPNAPGMPPMTGAPPQMPGPQAAPPMPHWQMPPAPQPPQMAWQPPVVAPPMPIPKEAPPLPKNESKVMKYLPLIIGLNVLFLIALLLIVIFALKK